MPSLTQLTPGEHSFFFTHDNRRFEALIYVPDKPRFDFVALLGHPHSLQGGTMQNKVVTTLVRAFSALNIPSIRFNFRGVGHSQGVYDNGIGESADMLHLRDIWHEMYPASRCFFAGFSFGSYVAYRAASQDNSPLITIAPPVQHYDFTEFKAPDLWGIIHGDADEVVPLADVETFVKAHDLAPPVVFRNVTHFFHGHLIPLKQVLIEMIQKAIAVCH